jgi:Zinc-binding dehydrogenase
MSGHGGRHEPRIAMQKFHALSVQPTGRSDAPDAAMFDCKACAGDGRESPRSSSRIRLTTEGFAWAGASPQPLFPRLQLRLSEGSAGALNRIGASMVCSTHAVARSLLQRRLGAHWDRARAQDEQDGRAVPAQPRSPRIAALGRRVRSCGIGSSGVPGGRCPSLADSVRGRGPPGRRPPPQRANVAYALRMMYALTEHHRRALDDVFRLEREGKLTVPIGGRLPLAEAVKAHDFLESRRSTGKLLLIP